MDLPRSRRAAARWFSTTSTSRCGSAARERSTENLTDGTPVTIFVRKPALRETGILPKGSILRLYGRAKIHKSGAVYEEIWNRLIEAEKKGDPEKRGYAVLVTIERAEDLSGQPLT
jgi:hypothetical protein